MLKVLIILFVLFGVVLLVKNENTYKNHIIILLAVKEAMDSQLDVWFMQGCPEDFTYEITPDNMEPYVKTLFRLWDWGYTRILPKDKFEIIKGYIEER